VSVFLTSTHDFMLCSTTIVKHGLSTISSSWEFLHEGVRYGLMPCLGPDGLVAGLFQRSNEELQYEGWPCACGCDSTFDCESRRFSCFMFLVPTHFRALHAKETGPESGQDAVRRTRALLHA